jgi:hypothetical protein
MSLRDITQIEQNGIGIFLEGTGLDKNSFTSLDNETDDVPKYPKH